MSRIVRTLGAAAIALSFAAATPAIAQQPPAEQDDGRKIEESLRKGIEKILRALEGLVDSVPIYEMPEVQENGDIIIRRKKRAPETEPAKPGRNGDSRST